jgi:single-stranded DNA-binding protein
MNVLTVAGRVASEPVRRETARGVVCEFRLAVECRPRLWIGVQTWGQLAGRCARHLTNGRTISVTGQLISEPYTTRAGEKVVRWYLRAATVSYLDRAGTETDIDEVAS